VREWLAIAERLDEVRAVKGATCKENIGLKRTKQVTLRKCWQGVAQ
jgi:hypothetical protein